MTHDYFMAYLYFFLLSAVYSAKRSISQPVQLRAFHDISIPASPYSEGFYATCLSYSAHHFRAAGAEASGRPFYFLKALFGGARVRIGG